MSVELADWDHQPVTYVSHLHGLEITPLYLTELPGLRRW
jgi:hypothetical protein